jgi:hypothetical protein
MKKITLPIIRLLKCKVSSSLAFACACTLQINAADVSITSTDVDVLQVTKTASQADWPDVIAAYITDRAKKQVALSVMEDMKAKLTSYTFLIELFPETSEMLKQMGASWISNEGAERMKRKLVTDLTNIPVKILSLRSDFAKNDKTGNPTHLKYRNPYFAYSYILYVGLLDVHNSSDRDFEKFKPAALKAVDLLIKECATDREIKGIDTNLVDSTSKKLSLFRAAINSLPMKPGTTSSLAISDIHNRSQLEVKNELGKYIRDIQLNLEESIDALRNTNNKEAYKDIRISDSDFNKLIYMTETVFELYEYIVKRDYSEASLSAIMLLRKTEVLTDPRWARWITLAGSFSSADTAEEKYNFIDKITDPISDYLNKRNTSRGEFYLGINAYLGVRYAYEKIEGSNISDSVLGVTAPLGLELGLGLGNNYIPYAGLLLAPFDVGTPATTRLRSSDVDGENIDDTGTTWEQIATPGCYILFALSKRYPVSLGIGTQYNPRLAVDGISGQKSWQIGGFLSIDIPLLRF